MAGEQPEQPGSNGPLGEIPGMTFVAPLPQQPKKSPLPFLLIAAVVVVLASVSLIAYSSMKSKTASNNNNNAATTGAVDVAKVLQQALSNGLSTGSVQHFLTYSAITFTAEQDATVVSNPKISMQLKRTANGQTWTAETYGTNTDSYVKYTNAPTTMVSAANQNQWIQVRAAGLLPYGASGYMSQMTSPQYVMLGAYIFGKFSNDQRTSLMNFISQKPVYLFDPAAVKQSVFDGKNVLVYKITFNKDNLVAYNKLVASMYGMKDADIADALSTLAYYGENTVYVDESSQQVVRVEYTYNNEQVVQRFGEFNQASLPAQPVGTRSYGKIIPQLVL